MGSALGAEYDMVLTLDSQVFEHLREPFRGMPWGCLEQARSENKWETNGFFLLKRLTSIDLFEGIWLVGTYFAASASPI